MTFTPPWTDQDYQHFFAGIMSGEPTASTARRIDRGGPGVVTGRVDRLRAMGECICVVGTRLEAIAVGLHEAGTRQRALIALNIYGSVKGEPLFTKYEVAAMVHHVDIDELRKWSGGW